MKIRNCFLKRFIPVLILALIIIPATPLSELNARSKMDSTFPCFKIDVPRYWICVSSGEGEWYFQKFMPNGIRIWLMLLVHKQDPGKSPARAKWIKDTGTAPDGAEWLTEGKPIRTKSGMLWTCHEGVFPTGRDHVTYSITIPGSDGYALSSSCMIVGVKSFLNKKSWTGKDAKLLRGILVSLRITENLKQCNPQRIGPKLLLPKELVRIAFAGKRGFLGAKFMTGKKPKKNKKVTILGADIYKINPGSPCIEAGIQKGDTAWIADSQLIRNAYHFTQILYWKNKDEVLKLHIKRAGKDITTDVKMAGYKKLQVKAENKPVSTGVSMDSFFKNNSSQIPEETNKDPIAKKPSLNIEGMNIIPSPVRAGSKFSFVIDLKAGDPSLFKKELEISMVHEILQNSNVIYTGKTEYIKIPNGKSYQLKKSLNATKRTGSYKIRVTIKYGDLKETASGSLKIR